MITGVFRDGHPYVPVTIFGQATALDVDFIVDTGFLGDLVLSRDVVAQLGLPFLSRRTCRLATGEEERFDVHIVTITWLEGQREVDVLVMDGDPLLGTGLLLGMLFQVEGIEGGEVVIEIL